MDKEQKKNIKKQVKKQVTKVEGKRKVSKTLGTLSRQGDYKGFLKGINPYYQTLVNPFLNHGVRIPDLITNPSSTFTLVKKITITANASGYTSFTCGLSATGWTFGAPIVPYGSILPLPDSTAGYRYIVGSYNTSYAGAANTSVIVGGTDWQWDQWTSAGSTVPALFTHARLVSCGVSIQYTGSDFTNKGMITGAVCPRGTIRAEMGNISGVGVVTLDPTRFANLADAKQVAVNRKDGMTLLYKPIDPISTAYQNLDIQTNYAGGIPANWPLPAFGAEMMLMVSGAEASVATFQVLVVANFESWSRNATNNLVSTFASKSDPISLSHAMNSVQELPVVKPGSAEATALLNGKGNQSLNILAGGTSSITHHKETEEQPSMMDKILKTVSDAVPVVEKLAPVVGKVLAMI